MQYSSATKPRCSQGEDFRSFLFGGYCHSCSEFDEDSFLKNWHPAVLMIYAFIGRHLKALYHSCDGDMVMALVMCEIWQYNVGRYLDRSGPVDATATLQDPEKRRELLPPCNAYSISQVVGVPSETVRRKVKKLIGRGWVERSNDGELISTRAYEEHFVPELTLELMRSFSSAARHVLAMVGREQPT